MSNDWAFIVVGCWLAFVFLVLLFMAGATGKTRDYESSRSAPPRDSSRPSTDNIDRADGVKPNS